MPRGGCEKETENQCAYETEGSCGPAPGKGGRDGQQRIEEENAELQSVAYIKIYLYALYIHKQGAQVNSSFTAS